MLYFKSCPRCQSGTIEHNSDSWGQYLQCLMCGYQRDFDAGISPARELAEARRQVAAKVAAAVQEEAAVA
jgi:DNA-directed RNA polymerase subunit M/transcription elongation factor TFIIS